MRLSSFVFLLLFCCLSRSFAQYSPEAEQIFNDAYALSKQNRYDEALKGFHRALSISPEHTNSHVMASWCYLIKGDFKNAAHHADYAHMLDQFYDVPYLSKAYVMFATEDPQAEHYIKSFFWLSIDPAAVNNVIQDCNDLINAGIKPQVFSNLKSRINSYANQDNSRFRIVADFLNNGAGYINNQNPDAALREFDKALQASVFDEPFAYVRPLVLNQIGLILHYAGNPVAPGVFEMALGEMSKYRIISPYIRMRAATMAAQFYFNIYNFEKMFNVLASYTRHAEAVPEIFGYDKANFNILLAKSVMNIPEKRGVVLQACSEIVKMPMVSNDQTATLRAYAYMFMGHAYQTSANNQERTASGDYFLKGIEIAKAYKLENVIAEIEERYGTFLYTMRRYDEAFAMLNNAIAYHYSQNDLVGAQTSMNNLGALYFGIDDYENAAKVLRRSVDLIEGIRETLSGETKLNYMQEVSASYAFLVYSLAATGKTSELFEVQNLQRGRVLSEMLGKDKLSSKVTMSEYQRMLPPDEATIIYSDYTPGSCIIHVITSKGAYAIINKQEDLFKSLRSKYVERIRAASNKTGFKPGYANELTADHRYVLQMDMDDMMQLTRDLLQTNDPAFATLRAEFLNAYYKLFFEPISQKLPGIKKLMIMPDGLANFLPFEALTSSQGEYLVSKFDIRYAQSADVRKIIASRNYGNQPKSLLAMGGAVYQNMRESAERIRGVDKMLELQSRANVNSLSGLSQREIYAALGFGQLNYLPGTLAEVQTIAKLVKGKADLFTGEQMTENKIKALSSSGELKNYKIIHLATHGFAIPQIPQLSGIAMCIFPTMQGNEDGYLTAPEISKLNMNAELAILSACETGLGKIYGGEGVTGLTQALLVGGANRAIVSLWPVSDEGTMHFMNGLYDLTENKGQTYDEAVNVMKRRFIKGEFGAAFSAPHIWAPFVHYGK